MREAPYLLLFLWPDGTCRTFVRNEGSGSECGEAIWCMDSGSGQTSCNKHRGMVAPDIPTRQLILLLKTVMKTIFAAESAIL